MEAQSHDLYICIRSEERVSNMKAPQHDIQGIGFTNPQTDHDETL
jgi:hypothetical protein